MMKSAVLSLFVCLVTISYGIVPPPRDAVGYMDEVIETLVPGSGCTRSLQSQTSACCAERTKQELRTRSVMTLETAQCVSQ